MTSLETKTQKHIKAFKAAFPDTIPVLTGFMCLGITYGILMQTKGYGALWSTLMSAAAFCGSMQFVAITFMTAVFDPVQALLLSFLVNARHIFYGLAFLAKYKGMGKLKGFLICTLCDETFSILSTHDAPEGIERSLYYFWTSFLNYIYWAGGTAVGGLLGNLITFNTAGMDFALTALFVVLFLEQWKKKENRFSGIAGIVCAGACLFVFGADNMVIPSMVLIMIALLAYKKVKKVRKA